MNHKRKSKSKTPINDWKGHAVERADFRGGKGEPEGPTPKKTRHKDKKRWCKGKVGREHEYRYVAIKNQNTWGAPSWFDVVCRKCNKECWEKSTRYRGVLFDRQKNIDWVKHDKVLREIFSAATDGVARVVIDSVDQPDWIVE